MAKIGTFTQTETGYTGTIHSMTLNVPCTFEAVTGDGNDKAPDYRIIDEAGVDVGAAWCKTNKDEKPYLAVKLEDPTLPRPIFANLVDQDGVFSLIWVRQ